MKKSELKAYIDELETKLEIANSAFDAMSAALENEQEVTKCYREWYQAEQDNAKFAEKCLRKIRYMLALDTVEQLTHRSRNERLRGLIYSIGNWLDKSQRVLYQDMDDIPF